VGSHSGVAVLAKGWAIRSTRRLAVKVHGNAVWAFHCGAGHSALPRNETPKQRCRGLSQQGAVCCEWPSPLQARQRRCGSPRQRPKGWLVSVPGRRCASWQGLRPLPARRALPATL